MRKLNVSMDMFGNTKKIKIKIKVNVTLTYLSLSWQASICLAYLPTSSFILSFFLLFSLFWSKYLFFDTVAWNPIYSRCYVGVWYEVSLYKKLKAKFGSFPKCVLKPSLEYIYIKERLKKNY